MAHDRDTSHHSSRSEPIGGEGVSTAPVSIQEHRERILAAMHPLGAREATLDRAARHVLAADVTASVDLPSFDNSAMDGYAVRHADARHATAGSPVSFEVVADLPAGSEENPRLKPGQAARIMTGAAVPDDADCIVPVEDTDGGTRQVLVTRAPEPAAHIRHLGTDVRAGATVLGRGSTLNARDLAAAAAAGASTVTVHPAPRVGVLSTGTELVPPGGTLRRGQIHDSNSTLLENLVAECGAIPVQIGSVPDDAHALEQTLDRHAPQVDAFVTSGGVSVGAYDVVKAVLAPRGVWFGPVRMQPGKPQGFGVWPDDEGGPGTPLFALPGNPVSVFVSFEAFVRPALRAQQGHTALMRESTTAVASTGWRTSPGRAQFMPALVERAPGAQADSHAAALTVRPASSGGSRSYLVASLARANALAFVPESVAEVREGDRVTVTLVS